MFTASTYDEIIKVEKTIVDREIVIFLFVKPNNDEAMNIVREFEYIHYSSKRYCSIYAIGYSDNFDKKYDASYRKVDKVLKNDWYFSSKAFAEFKEKLEDRIGWKYSGENEVLILQNNPEGRDPLNFTNYVSININKGLREGYIDSFQMFMESLIRSSKINITAAQAIRQVANDKISLKNIIIQSLEECKNVPAPVKSIVKDRLFYRTAQNFLR